MEYSQKAVKDLIPYINNARTHSDEQVTQIASSIREFGFINPIIIDDKNNVIAGHGRLLASKKLDLKEVPTVLVDHLTDTQRKAYVLADNQLALNAGWDDELLKLELAQLDDVGFDLELLGFDLDALEGLGVEELELEEQEVPEPAEDPISKLGELWTLGNHRLMCGDSTQVSDVEKLMAGQKADMVFTDPPYGMFLNADYSDMDRKFKGSNGGNKYDQVIGDNEDFSPDLISTVFASFNYCKEIFLWGADYYAEHLPNKNNGSWIVWDKRGDDSADKMYGSTFELCWSKARHKRIMARVKWAGIFGMEKEHDKKRCHPTQKPVELVKWFFDYFSLEDKNNVVDLFGGSGSTLIACEKTKRKCFMMELDPKYCDVIIKRWQNLTGNDAVLESTGETYNSLEV